LDLVEEFCVSPLGIAHVRNIKFYTNADDIQRHLHETNEFRMLLENPQRPFPQENYLDLRDELKIMELENAVLTEGQLFNVLKVISAVQLIIDFFSGDNDEARENYVHIFRIINKYEVDKDLLNQIKRVIDDEGKIKSSASNDLTVIRNQINAKFQELNRTFRSVIQEYRKRKWLVDEGESIRNGRRVLMVQSEFKRKVKGVILDVSASGKTTFIEPDTTLQVNNELFELQNDEKREIERILRVLTADLRPQIEVFAGYQKLLGILDFIRAKGKLAQILDAAMPSISPERVVELHLAYHPLLFLINKKAKKKTVPLSLRLSIADRILVISGPNAGGKSVALKTVGLLQLMFQSGMLIPAEVTSRLCVFNSILVDIGDEQSLENDLSTYSSRLKNMRHFIDFADNKSMVLIDEFGSGTDPKFGGAIAESVLNELNKKRVYGVLTTHYSNLKIYASQTSGVINGAMGFHKEKLEPMYSLEIGKPGSSFAFELATKSNLKRERKRKEFEKRRKTLLLKAEQAAAENIKETNRKLENMVREWQEDKANKKKAAAIRSELADMKTEKSELIESYRDEVLQKDSVGELVEGASVQLRTGGRSGVVLELRKNEAVVKFGSLKTKVKLKELVVVNAPNIAPPPKTYVGDYHELSRTADFSNSIDVRGMRVEEAIKRVEELLDNALIVNADELKVIHGRGTGALRRTIRSTFKKYKAVKSIRNEDPEYGGDGISVIELG